MAKKSAIEKNNMRKRMVAKYAAKRAALLEIANNRELPIEERFKARLDLASVIWPPKVSFPAWSRRAGKEAAP